MCVVTGPFMANGPRGIYAVAVAIPIAIKYRNELV